MIHYPYLPENRTILYVAGSNPHMMRAKELAYQYRGNLHHPAGAVVVKGEMIIGEGSIGNNPVHLKGCLRVTLNMPTGEGYELCQGCHPKNHSERRAIADAERNGHNTRGADLYLWGHWWACELCWQVIIEAGIENVYLLEGSEKLFNKSHPDNIIGRQFEIP